MILGAFTAAINNNPHNKIATDLVKGDILVLEYFEPPWKNKAKLMLSGKQAGINFSSCPYSIT